jgi:hypothetical protein
MSIRFQSPFLCIIGSIFGILALFTTSLFPSFMFGLCFVGIFRNLKDKANGKL